MTLYFVAASRGNAFMVELLATLAAAVRTHGVDASVSMDAFPDDPAARYVVVPHELFPLLDAERQPTREQRARTIGLCVEMPGTEWFDLTVDCASVLARSMAINVSAVDELRREGVAAEHLQLGYWPGWDAWHGDPSRERPVAVSYLGSADPRRSKLLAGYADSLAAHPCRILVPPLDPKTGPRPDFVIDGDKHRLLASSQVLINLHRGESRSFEWVRVLETMCNGAVVLTEASHDHAPLVPGEHFIVADALGLGLLADHVLHQPERLAAIRTRAYDYLRSSLLMTDAAARLIEVAGDLADGAVVPAVVDIARSPAVVPAPPLAPPTELDRLRASVKTLAVEQVETKRLLQHLGTRNEVGFDADGAKVVATSAAYETAMPRVTVCIPVYNHATEVREALASVARSELTELEVLVYDDVSSDDSSEVVAEFLRTHPEIPGQLLVGRVNAGPSHGRNVLSRRARGEFLFFLDSDNQIYPRTLGVLAAALDADRGAAFAYSSIASIGREGPVGLLSASAWDPQLLRRGNYIDTMSMVRRDWLLDIGGFGEDIRLMGWEDYDLWCRCAARGGRGLHVPEILGRYRSSLSGLLEFVNIDTPSVAELIRTRAPSVFLPQQRPDDVVPAQAPARP